MKNNRGLSAFSLIEVSITLLIIGILVAGVTQSSRLIKQSKLNAAKTITQSSPVSSIKNLMLWIETTSDSSFDDTETDDGLAITNWYDLNPQSSVKNHFAQATADNKPLYKTDIINGLPAIKFDASNDFMQSVNFPNIITGASTVFLVIKTPATFGTTAILSKRVGSGNTGTNLHIRTTTSVATNGLWQYCDSVTSTGAINCYFSTPTTPVETVNNSYVLSATYTANTASGINFWQNGTSIVAGTADTTNNSPSLSPTSTDYLYLGKNGVTATPTYFSGYIGEIIIYDRSLKTEERRAVESYLGKKWGIAIS